ncbi:MAG: type I-E CRISPR-associated protein Cas7/Cse4/CasC [Thermodesulfobacteriota bacterium]
MDNGKFVQLHILTSYPASNLNRDDLGRPKTVVMGNTQRLRVSSQSLKRAWRISDVFREALGGALGARTKELGVAVFCALTQGATLAEALQDKAAAGGLPRLKEKPALAVARAIAGVFGKIKPEAGKKAKAKKGGEAEDAEAGRKALLESAEIEQMAYLSPAEIAAAAALVEQGRASGKEPADDALSLLRKDALAADMAMFGRMVAARPEFNVEAAVQVAHAMTVHTVAVEDDFFTAVDDLNKEDVGAGHMGVAEFGAGLYYLYLCIDRDLLRENLGGDADLAGRALRALARAACTVSPSGKQSSYASRSAASYCLAEKGADQPRTLSSAFLDGLDRPGGLLARAVETLEQTKKNMDAAYEQKFAAYVFHPARGQGGISGLLDFVAG